MFAAIPFDTWLDVVERVPRPWPEHILVADLRAHQAWCLYGRGRWPTLEEWRDRAGGSTVGTVRGWSKRRLLELLADERRWQDPGLAADWRGYYADVVRGRSGGGAKPGSGRPETGLKPERNRSETGAEPESSDSAGSNVSVGTGSGQERTQDETGSGHVRGYTDLQTEDRSDPPPSPSAPAEGATLGSLGPVLEAELPTLPMQLLVELAAGAEASLRDLRAELRRRRRWPADAPRLRTIAAAVRQLAEHELGAARQRDEADRARRSAERALEVARCIADAAYLGVDPPLELDEAVVEALNGLLGVAALADLRRVAVDARVAEAGRVARRETPAAVVRVEPDRADPALVRAKLAAWRAGRAA